MSQVAVIGAGAIGGYVAAMAVQAGHDVTLCVRTPIPHLRVEDHGEVRTVAARIATTPAGVRRPAGLVVLAVKTHDTAGTTPWLRRLVGPHTTVLVLQNGVDHSAAVHAVGCTAAPGAHPAVVPAVVYTGASLRGPGHVVPRPGGRVYVPDDEAGRRVAMTLGGSQLSTVPAADFEVLRWQKFCLNVASGAVTALFRQPLGIVRQPSIAGLVRGLAAEAVAVAAGLGHRLGDDVPGAIVADLQGRPRDASTSMLRDRLAGRPLELGALNQTVLTYGDTLGLAVPLNRLVTHALTESAGTGAGRPAAPSIQPDPGPPSQNACR